MSRYIDAEKLKDDIANQIDVCKFIFGNRLAEEIGESMNGVYRTIDRQPTADVVERRENPIDAEEAYWRFKDVDGHKNLVIRLKGMVTDVTDIRIRLDKYNLKEVVSGEWVFNSYDEDAYDVHGNKSWANRYYCSNCNFEHAFIEDHTGQYNYCPNCGADMRGIRDDNN